MIIILSPPSTFAAVTASSLSSSCSQNPAIPTYLKQLNLVHNSTLAVFNWILLNVRSPCVSTFNCSGFPKKFQLNFTYRTNSTCPTNHIIIQVIILAIFGKEYETRFTSLCYFFSVILFLRLSQFQIFSLAFLLKILQWKIEWQLVK
jgi:hypothetical protein